MPIRPPRLEPGGWLGVVSPSSPPPDPANVDRAVTRLESLGFRVRLAKNARKRLGFLAGTDRERAADLMSLFCDRRINAIVCVRGGYGAARLLPLLDYSLIRQNPKIFVGYSDITSLHCALLRETDMISFHGPMLNGDFANADLPRFTLRSFLRTLSEPKAVGDIAAGYRRATVKVLRKGRARGRLIGGNLSLICSTLGTPWQPDFRGRILFLEDVGEQPYRFDRMLTQLLNCDVLRQVAGVAIGLNADCGDPKAKRAREYRQSLDDVLRDRLTGLGVPVVTGLPFGHVPLNATLPVGARAILDGNAGTLMVDEPAVA